MPRYRPERFSKRAEFFKLLLKAEQMPEPTSTKARKLRKVVEVLFYGTSYDVMEWALPAIKKIIAVAPKPKK